MSVRSKHGRAVLGLGCIQDQECGPEDLQTTSVCVTMNLSRVRGGEPANEPPWTGDANVDDIPRVWYANARGAYLSLIRSCSCGSSVRLEGEWGFSHVVEVRLTWPDQVEPESVDGESVNPSDFFTVSAPDLDQGVAIDRARQGRTSPGNDSLRERTSFFRFSYVSNIYNTCLPG